MPPTIVHPDAIMIQVFAQRLMRVFARNQAAETCTCELRSGHLPTCPKHPWEMAELQTQMEMEDSIRSL